MFNNTMSGMSIAVNGGNSEENAQMCSVVAAALRTYGFNNVQIDPGHEYPSVALHDHETISAMRSLNPALFDTPISVAGESESDPAMDMAAMGFARQPFAFRIERGSHY